jgi:DNA-binding NarL/FixJ family response regulator
MNKARRAVFFAKPSRRARNTEIVGEGRTGADALRLCRKLEPAVLLMELQFRDMAATSVVSELRAMNSPTTNRDFHRAGTSTALIDGLRNRPHGFVHKDDIVSRDLEPAGGRGARRLLDISPSLTCFTNARTSRVLPGELTTRERMVLQMIADGQPSKASGSALACRNGQLLTTGMI